MDLAEYSHAFVMTIVVLLVPGLFRALIPAPATQSTQAVSKPLGRLVAFDAVRGVAIIAVILIHVCAIIGETEVPVNPYFLDALNAAMRFCIPIFFICTGALLTPFVHKDGAYREYFGPKCMRIAVPYILVTAVLTGMGNGGVYAFLQNVVTGQITPPFYFVIVLFQFYALYPFIERFAHTRRFVIGSLAVTILALFTPSLYYIAGVPTFFTYTFFFVWGIYMSPALLSGVRQNLLPFVWIIVFAIFTYILFPGQYYNIRPYYGISMFVCLFTFFVHGHFERTNKFFGWLGTFTLWIFLTHYPLLKYGIPKMATLSLPTWVFVMMVSVVSVFLSIAFGYVCSRTYGWCARIVYRALH